MKPYKLASREFHEDDSVVEVGGGKSAWAASAEGEGRRHARRVHRRAVRRREREDAQHDRPPRPRRRRDDPPRRRLQAPHQPLLLPGPRRDGPEVDARVRRRAGHADLHRGDGHPAGRADREVHRHVPDRRAEHAELRPAPRGRQDAQARAAQARPGRDGEGLAAVRRVRAEPGEQAASSCASAGSRRSRTASATRWTSARSRWRGSGATCR